MLDGGTLFMVASLPCITLSSALRPSRTLQGQRRAHATLGGTVSPIKQCATQHIVYRSGGQAADCAWVNHRIREHITGVLRGHEQEVCGLKWSPSGTQLASGGNDNLLHIWSATGARAVLLLLPPCSVSQNPGFRG